MTIGKRHYIGQVGRRDPPGGQHDKPARARIWFRCNGVMSGQHVGTFRIDGIDDTQAWKYTPSIVEVD